MTKQHLKSIGWSSKGSMNGWPSIELLRRKMKASPSSTRLGNAEPCGAPGELPLPHPADRETGRPLSGLLVMKMLPRTSSSIRYQPPMHSGPLTCVSEK